MQDCGTRARQQDPSASASGRDRIDHRDDKVPPPFGVPANHVKRRVQARFLKSAKRSSLKSLCINSAFRGNLPRVAPSGLVGASPSDPVPEWLKRAADPVSARAKNALFPSSFLEPYDRNLREGKVVDVHNLATNEKCSTNLSKDFRPRVQI